MIFFGTQLIVTFTLYVTSVCLGIGIASAFVTPLLKYEEPQERRL